MKNDLKQAFLNAYPQIFKGCFLLFFCLFLSFCGSNEKENPKTKTLQMDAWVYGIFKDKGQTLLKDMIIPGTHDAGTYAIDQNSEVSPDADNIVAADKKVSAGWGKTQNHSLKKQLENGIRHFDLRILKHKEEFVIVHGLISFKLSKGLKEIADFTKAHPKEPILIEYALLPSSSDLPKLLELSLKHLKDHLVPSSFKATQLSLNDLWNSGKSVIIFAKNGDWANEHHELWDYSANLSGTWANTTDLKDLKEKLYQGLKNRNPEQFFWSAFTFTPNQKTILDGVFKQGPTNLFDLTKPIFKTPGDWLPGWLEEGLKINIITCDFYEHSNLVETAIKLNKILLQK